MLLPQMVHNWLSYVGAAVAALQGIYDRNDFPVMEVSWDVYPENNRHFIFDGCFRCHDGLHRSADGRVVTHECRNGAGTIRAAECPVVVAWDELADVVRHIAG